MIFRVEEGKGQSQFQGSVGWAGERWGRASLAALASATAWLFRNFLGWRNARNPGSIFCDGRAM